MEQNGYVLNWKKCSFKVTEIFECEEFPSVYTWYEAGTVYIRMGSKLFKKPGMRALDFESVEEFLVKKSEDFLDTWYTRAEERRHKNEQNNQTREALLRELEELNMLVQSMFK